MSDETKFTKAMVRSLVNTLKPQIQRRGQITFDICHIIYKLKDDNTFKLLTPNKNWKSFLRSQKIPMSYSNSNKAVQIYTQFKDKNYSKDSMVNILAEFGLSKTYELIRQFPTRVSINKLRRLNLEAERQRELERGMQLHLEIATDRAKKCTQVLTTIGMREDESGRKHQASEAFENLCSNYAKLERFARGKQGAPKLSMVKKKAA